MASLWRGSPRSRAGTPPGWCSAANCEVLEAVGDLQQTPPRNCSDFFAIRRVAMRMGMEARSADLETVEWGKGEATRVALLVHGLTGSAEAFELLVEDLDPAEGSPGRAWLFIAPDLRGRGASRGPGRHPGARATSWRCNRRGRCGRPRVKAWNGVTSAKSSRKRRRRTALPECSLARRVARPPRLWYKPFVWGR